MFTVYTDGAARGNPGESASGFAVYRGSHLIHKQFEYNGVATNNHAEYMAVILALRWCKAHAKEPTNATIELYSDSELVVRQLNRQYKTKSSSLKPQNSAVKKLAANFRFVSFHNVRRENRNIAMVDRALNALLDERKRQQKL